MLTRCKMCSHSLEVLIKDDFFDSFLFLFHLIVENKLISFLFRLTLTRIIELKKMFFVLPMRIVSLSSCFPLLLLCRHTHTQTITTKTTTKIVSFSKTFTLIDLTASRCVHTFCCCCYFKLRDFKI